MGTPENFFFSYSTRALTSTNVRYWGLALPLTANPPFIWTFSWLTKGGALSLSSSFFEEADFLLKVLHHLCHSGYGSSCCTSCLSPETTLCSTRGTSFLFLEATSFSPMGSDATDGTLVPLLFLGLQAMLCEGTASSISFAQSPPKSP